MNELISKKLVVEAKHSFNNLLRTAEYKTIISDDSQRKRLIELLRVRPKGSYLDLATGNGYVGFAIAEQYPDCSVEGLDIANEVIIEDRNKVKEQTLANIDFKIFNGIKFPVFDTNFDGVVCRYALHHFPEIDLTLKEINRVLKNVGRVVISDAIKNEYDNEDFINKFQGLKVDGHVKMYTRHELVSLLKKHNFTEAESFDSKITFSRELNPKYKKLLQIASQEIKNLYSVAVIDNEVSLTFNILNIAFIKRS